MAGRSINITKDMTADAVRMLELLGIPALTSPSEAEA